MYASPGLSPGGFREEDHCGKSPDFGDEGSVRGQRRSKSWALKGTRAENFYENHKKAWIFGLKF